MNTRILLFTGRVLVEPDDVISVFAAIFIIFLNQTKTILLCIILYINTTYYVIIT